MFRFGRRAFKAAAHRVRIIPQSKTDSALVLGLMASVYMWDIPQQIIKAREGQKPLFIPISFAREMREHGIHWEKDDPEYLDLVELSKDGRRQKEVFMAVLEFVTAAQRNLPRTNAFHYADCTANWLFIKYPAGPPPRYERYGIELSLTGTKLTKREVSYLSVHRARLLLNPMSFIGCMSRAWSTTRQLRESERAQISQEQADENVAGSWITTTRVLQEPFGYQFGYHLLSELKKTWKPPTHIPRGHVRVEGFVEFTGNGRVCIMDVDVSINPKTMQEVNWRSGEVRFARAFRMGPPEDPRRTKRLRALRQAQREAVIEFERKEREMIRLQMELEEHRQRQQEEAENREVEEEEREREAQEQEQEQQRATAEKSDVSRLVERAQEAIALKEKISTKQAQAVSGVVKADSKQEEEVKRQSSATDSSQPPPESPETNSENDDSDR